jgi:hypothetical protein
MAAMYKARPWQDLKTGLWYLRRRLPERYLAVANKPGKDDQIKISLGTTDKNEAERRWPEALLKWDALVMEWECRLNVVALTPERAREVAARWAVSVAGGSTKLELHAAADAAIRHHADEALKLAGITVAPDTMPLLFEAIEPMVAAAYQQAELEPGEPRSDLLTRRPDIVGEAEPTEAEGCARGYAKGASDRGATRPSPDQAPAEADPDHRGRQHARHTGR